MRKNIVLKRLACAGVLLCLLCSTLAACGSPAATGSAPTAKFDVDLSTLSSTMVYAEVNNIVTKPDSYVGKTIRVAGKYTTNYSDETKQQYHFVILSDATACCAQGLEFILNNSCKGTTDYPEQDADILISGVYDSYDELGETYYYVNTDSLTVVQ